MSERDQRADAPSPEGDHPEIPHPPTHPPGTVGDDRRFFREGRPGSLREQRDLLDDDGDDIRLYTGEPVETDDGWIVPEQQNQPGNAAGGGEFPDPNSPPVQPRDGRSDGRTATD